MCVCVCREKIHKQRFYFYLGHTDGLFTYIDPENHNVMMRSVENGTKQVLLDSADLVSMHNEKTCVYDIQYDGGLYILLFFKKKCRCQVMVSLPSIITPSQKIPNI